LRLSTEESDRNLAVNNMNNNKAHDIEIATADGMYKQFYIIKNNRIKP
jgi:hypothetical protein